MSALKSTRGGPGGHGSTWRLPGGTSQNTENNIFKPNKPEKNQNVWRDVVRPSRCNAFAIARFLVFLSRTYIAARRRSGAPSKVYQWLGPRCRQKVTGKNFTNRPPNFYRGSKSAKFGLDSQNQSPLTGSSFETEQHIGNLKHVSGA